MMSESVVLPHRRVQPRSLSSYTWPLAYLPLLITVPLCLAANPLQMTALLPVAVLFGWTQIGGLCGAVHLNTMGYLWRRSRVLWLKAMPAYTCCGLITATGVGALLGWVGAHVVGRGGTAPILGVGVFACVLAAREAGWLHFRLVERVCQTDRNWMYQFGWVTACAMWGAHIGLGFGTVITYGGFWALAGVILAAADPIYGSILMGTYWIGRSLPLWTVAPLTIPVEWKAQALYPLFRPVQAIGLMFVAFVLIAIAFRGY